MSLINSLKVAAVLCLIITGSSSVLAATPPFLAFSDLVSGAPAGLQDGKGSGVIVTVWGQNLGDAKKGNEVFFEDSSGEVRPVSHVYYWKRADGVEPSGPANLFKSHKMQEIAFSIPDSAMGPGKIFVRVNGLKSNELEFMVRPGSIYFVAGNGVDKADAGSFSSPWRTVSYADKQAQRGSTIYILDVDTGDRNSQRAIYWNNSNASSTIDAQFAYIAYPGYQPKVVAQKAVENYKTEGMVVSKLDIYASNYLDVDEYGQPLGEPMFSGDTYGIQSSKNGRAISNRIGDIPGGCANKWNGAINGNARSFDRVSNFKAFGNEIYDYGCNGTDKLHHTVYLSVRNSEGLIVDPWEWGYNFLHGNKAKFGIHQYDEGNVCGDLSGPLKIHNNVIINQSGSGISIGSVCGWSMDMYIENNILINVGLATDWDGIDPDTSNGAENGGIGFRDGGLLGTAYVRNNLIYGYSEDGQTIEGRGCLNLTGHADNIKVNFVNNICYTERSQPFVGVVRSSTNKLDNVVGSNNIWIDDGSQSSDVPTWDKSPYTSVSGLKITDSNVSVEEGSSLLGKGSFIELARDIYGVPRGRSADIGPVTFDAGAWVFPPAAPSNLFVE